MAWVESEDYLGPDRRRRRKMRLVERRSNELVQPPPSLQLLLRKLRMWAPDVVTGDHGAIDRYCARLDVVAEVARERGELGAAAELVALAETLRSTPCCNVADISKRRLEAAMVTLAAPDQRAHAPAPTCR